ncbi:hypothetical protein ElyMa_003190500 [Elysia marginata]|uniref:Uncharacterized protein n=1 Tax=Elysia marginata TaxID=1093978 RepID=A0AAV4J107_9GAST|nr:hypothetical protein ElyMa_003190500 [Elysia marginata]
MHEDRGQRLWVCPHLSTSLSPGRGPVPEGEGIPGHARGLRQGELGAVWKGKVRGSGQESSPPARGLQQIDGCPRNWRPPHALTFYRQLTRTPSTQFSPLA